MTLLINQVKCARELFLDLWMDPDRDSARSHIGWISRYNFTKATWAVNGLCLRLQTNIPSLYIVWDPEVAIPDDLAEFRGLSRNPAYVQNFLDKYKKLTDNLDKDGTPRLFCQPGVLRSQLLLYIGQEAVLPFSQELAELYEMSYHLARTSHLFPLSADSNGSMLTKL